MRILLVQPANAPATIGGEDIFIYEPLALEYVAAGVADSHDVRILDLRMGDDLVDELEDFRPDVVGITAYTVHVNVARRLFDDVKRWNPGVVTVIGGHHATLLPDDFLSPSIDAVVIGDGVSAFREIVESIERGRPLDGIPGVAVPGNGGLTTPGRRAPEELDGVPFPARALTARYRSRYYSEWMKPLATIRTSKGCPYRCSFCALWKLTGGRYLRRDPEKVVEELKTIAEPFVFFADDESLIDTGRMQRLADLIRAAGIRKRYFLYGRADTIARSPALLASWREIGLERVFIGFEFTRDEDLRGIRKGSTVSDNEAAARILNDLGIEIYGSFIVRPDFTREDFAAFAPYCEKLGLRFASFAVLTPLPGTDLMAQVENQLITRNYDFFDFIHTLLPTALPLDEFFEQLYALYARAIPLRRQLPMLRKYRVLDFLTGLRRGRRVLGQMRGAYRDYQASAPVRPAVHASEA
ncbi:MAG TPA: radical SAM protein [Thermoanaerobaculia bacterium]|nr:radical SAM protein [Thermoanaerobaculia bacterium]